MKKILLALVILPMAAAARASSLIDPMQNDRDEGRRAATDIREPGSRDEIQPGGHIVSVGDAAKRILGDGAKTTADGTGAEGNGGTIRALGNNTFLVMVPASGLSAQMRNDLGAAVDGQAQKDGGRDTTATNVSAALNLADAKDARADKAVLVLTVRLAPEAEKTADTPTEFVAVHVSKLDDATRADGLSQSVDRSKGNGVLATQKGPDLTKAESVLASGQSNEGSFRIVMIPPGKDGASRAMVFADVNALPANLKSAMIAQFKNDKSIDGQKVYKALTDSDGKDDASGKSLRVTVNVTFDSKSTKIEDQKFEAVKGASVGVMPTKVVARQEVADARKTAARNDLVTHAAANLKAAGEAATPRDAKMYLNYAGQFLQRAVQTLPKSEQGALKAVINKASDALSRGNTAEAATLLGTVQTKLQAPAPAAAPAAPAPARPPSMLGPAGGSGLRSVPALGPTASTRLQDARTPLSSLGANPTLSSLQSTLRSAGGKIGQEIDARGRTLSPAVASQVNALAQGFMRTMNTGEALQQRGQSDMARTNYDQAFNQLSQLMGLLNPR